MQKYIVGSNMPGYMPDSDNFEADDFQHAIRCLIGDIEREIEMIDADGDEDAGDEISHAEGCINKLEEIAKKGEEREITLYVNHRAFWIAFAID